MYIQPESICSLVVCTFSAPSTVTALSLKAPSSYLGSGDQETNVIPPALLTGHLLPALKGYSVYFNMQDAASFIDGLNGN